MNVISLGELEADCNVGLDTVRRVHVEFYLFGLENRVESENATRIHVLAIAVLPAAEGSAVSAGFNVEAWEGNRRAILLPSHTLEFLEVAVAKATDEGSLLDFSS